MRKVLAVGLAVIMLLCTTVTAFADSGYQRINVDIPVKGDGVFVLARGTDPNDVVSRQRITGSGSFTVICDEPADVEYLVYREGEPQKEKSYLVYIAVRVDENDQLSAKLSVANAATGEKDETINYQPQEPCWDDPPVQKEIQGTPAFTPGFGFTMTAKDPTNPMPEGCMGVSKDVAIRGAGAVEFGKITFTEAGIYEYNITEKNLGLPGCTYDDSVYLLRYNVADNDGKLSFIRSIYKNGVLQPNMSTITFVNVFGGNSGPYNPNDPNNPIGAIKTGDAQNLGAHIVLSVIALTAFVIFASLLLKGNETMLKGKKEEGNRE